VFAFQASLHAIRVGGFDCQHITGDHFRDVIHWLKPSINSEELHSYLWQFQVVNVKRQWVF